LHGRIYFSAIREELSMSLIGKILAGLNILMAAVFIYAAAQDWSRRTAWTYAVYRYDLAIDGLPVDEDQVDTDGDRLTDKLSDKTFQDVMKSVGGAPAKDLKPEDKTQEAEVKRVQDKLRQEIQGAGDEKAQRAKLALFLVPQARTLGERQELANRIQSASWNELMGPDGPFETTFKQAMAKKNDKGAAREPLAKRQAIAHLLCNLNLDPQAYERVQVVVGFKEFAREMNHQAASVNEMAQLVHQAMYRDRSAFDKEHRHKINELQMLAQQVADRNAELQRLVKLAADHDVLVRTRQTDLTELKDKLETARADFKKALDELQSEQQKLFNAQHGVAITARENLGLEKQIRDLEKTDRQGDKGL
jgi:hypothetical protein